MPSKEEILDLVARIRKAQGMEDASPVIKEVVENDHLYIIAEDRPDKSILLGSSIVAGELRKRLGRPLTILSETELCEKRRRLEENMEALRKTNFRPTEKLLLLCEEELRFPKNRTIFFPPSGESLVVFCNNSYAVKMSETLGLAPVIITLKYSYPKTTRRLSCRELDVDCRDCHQCYASLLEEAERMALEEKKDVVFCNMDSALDYEGDMLLCDLQRLLFRTDWELKRNERCLKMLHDEKSVGFWTREIAGRVYEGLIEPGEGARRLYEIFKRVKA